MFLSVYITPVFTREYLKKEAELKDEMREKVIFGRLDKRAGFERETEQSVAKAKRVSPRLIEEAFVIPKVFQVPTGASSSYCPKIN